jgi:hypothetical protein
MGRIRAKIVLALLGLSMSLVGCRYDPTVWKLDLRSPDGAWLSSARTDQYGGFGTASIETVVTLKKLDGTVNKGKPFDILAYPENGPIPKPYVLSDSNAGGGVNLKMNWLTPRNLEIDYSGNIEPDLQVVKFGGIDISFRQLSP